jgi:SPP1 gp7 family putative phage head morphogenesis protein
VAETRTRIKWLKKQLRKFLIEDDELGLKPLPKFTIQKREFEFASNPDKLKAFKQWLTRQVNAGILTADVKGKPWNAKYIESAYTKGMINAYNKLNPESLAESPAFYEGSRAQFIRTSFTTRNTVKKIELLYTRAFDELKGVTDTMSQQMGRILAEGLSQGKGVFKIAREMDRSISTLTRTRAEVIARTEIIRAHAEGSLDAYESLGVKELEVEVEFTTAGDDLVCPLCSELEGRLYTVEEARGIIPVHPNCRCAWIPTESEKKKRKAG